jgi:hypothetical protein
MPTEKKEGRENAPAPWMDWSSGISSRYAVHEATHL